MRLLLLSTLLARYPKYIPPLMAGRLGTDDMLSLGWEFTILQMTITYSIISLHYQYSLGSILGGTIPSLPNAVAAAYLEESEPSYMVWECIFRHNCICSIERSCIKKKN